MPALREQAKLFDRFDAEKRGAVSETGLLHDSTDVDLDRSLFISRDVWSRSGVWYTPGRAGGSRRGQGADALALRRDRIT
jgi:hypothetical protein